jgi:2-dehydropantoate 2-reductase
MKIAVLGGAGAMGSVFGAHLGGAGHDVTLVDPNAEAVERISRAGLVIEQKSGERETHRLAAVTGPAGLASLDLVINFVKPALQSIQPALKADGAVLSLQNGWGNAPVIAEIVGEERVFMGVTYHSATVIGPGHVLHAGQGTTFVGPLT